jgi:hypothetical protein
MANSSPPARSGTERSRTRKPAKAGLRFRHCAACSENYQNGELLIARSIWNGIATDPKSRKSKAPIPIVGLLATKLAAHRGRLGNPTAGPMFPNGAKNAVDPDSLLHRIILPALEVCEHCSKPEAEHGKATHAWRGMVHRDGEVRGSRVHY